MPLTSCSLNILVTIKSKNLIVMSLFVSLSKSLQTCYISLNCFEAVCQRLLVSDHVLSSVGILLVLLKSTSESRLNLSTVSSIPVCFTNLSVLSLILIQFSLEESTTITCAYLIICQCCLSSSDSIRDLGVSESLIKVGKSGIIFLLIGSKRKQIGNLSLDFSKTVSITLLCHLIAFFLVFLIYTNCLVSARSSYLSRSCIDECVDIRNFHCEIVLISSGFPNAIILNFIVFVTIEHSSNFRHRSVKGSESLLVSVELLLGISSCSHKLSDRIINILSVLNDF